MLSRIAVVTRFIACSSARATSRSLRRGAGFLGVSAGGGVSALATGLAGTGAGAAGCEAAGPPQPAAISSPRTAPAFSIRFIAAVPPVFPSQTIARHLVYLNVGFVGSQPAAA